MEPLNGKRMWEMVKAKPNVLHLSENKWVGQRKKDRRTSQKKRKLPRYFMRTGIDIKYTPSNQYSHNKRTCKDKGKAPITIISY